MLPAYIPNPVAALFGGGTPIDFGRDYSDGRRVFGDGKTYRGFVAGILAGIGIGLLEIWFQGNFGQPYNFPQHTLITVLVLSTGALLGEPGKKFLQEENGKRTGR